MKNHRGNLAKPKDVVTASQARVYVLSMCGYLLTEFAKREGITERGIYQRTAHALRL